MPINFKALIERFGEVAAWHYLAEIEKAANIKPRYDICDPEFRLEAAIKAQDILSPANDTTSRIAA